MPDITSNNLVREIEKKRDAVGAAVAPAVAQQVMPLLEPELAVTFAGVVTAQGKGAVGDGAADDTAKLQAAVTAAASSGQPVEVRGRLKITAPIVLPTGKPLTIRASGRDVNPWGPLSANRASIESSGAAVFTAADGGAVPLHLEGVNFRNANGGITTALFDGVFLNESSIVNCTATGYNYAFKGGNITGVTRVNGNRFLSIKTAFSSASIVDAIITENYINGDGASNPVVFTGEWAASLFQGNFVDFFKRVWDVPAGQMNDVRAVGNIFDYCWAVFGTSTGATLTGITAVGNTFGHCKASVALPYFPNADADMTGTAWRGLSAVAGITSSTFVGNKFAIVDTAYHIADGAVGNLHESGSIFGEVTTKITFGYSYKTSEDVCLQAVDTARTVVPFSDPLFLPMGAGGVFEVTLTDALSNVHPANGGAIDNHIYEVHFIQDAPGSRQLLDSSVKFKWAGSRPPLSTGAGKRDIFRFRYDAAADAYYEVSRAMNVG